MKKTPKKRGPKVKTMGIPNHKTRLMTAGHIPCPTCQSPNSMVINSRGVEEGVRRQRVCPQSHRYFTIERVESRA